ncbi:hypothetical protein B0I35DRAFT_202088 [Stachybotrys elegans]|uniref:Shugoshin n=1 Tax=Stachybotrys elegans TaxID=80388 RepID=A0A8K0SY14_9HYPO|nr:hypothetical protein B0I35DRAFT_202088 [Stachybotrys elegans]
MARLNEIPMSSDNIETLRRKMLRQNRDLAKSNNIRALRIRELENECACMLSENLELRGRILELEKQVEDNESRRIADHALAIKAKLESQLTEWGILLAGLGLEPPMKRHSPRIRKTVIKQRMSFSGGRPSPSQRRLRDVARDIEELGHISENKSYPRMSLNPEQILALRSEADEVDSVDSPDLGPPPMSQFIDDVQTKIDSPSRAPPISPRVTIEPPVTLPSPEPEKFRDHSPSPVKKREPIAEVKKAAEAPSKPAPKLNEVLKSENTAAPPAKIGSKRKLAARDEVEASSVQRVTDENQPLRTANGKVSIREKAEGRTLKELASLRKEAKQRPIAQGHSRKPLAAKSTNDDVASPKKGSQPTGIDEVAAAKADSGRAKPTQDRPKAKPRNLAPIKIEQVPVLEPPQPAVVEVPCEPAASIEEAALLSPSSPEPVASNTDHGGDTPPPADISSQGETSRPSRRNRAAISYAEPNLRDKMRRPTKELFDAVAGETRYSRRSSQCEVAQDIPKLKRESDVEESWKDLPATNIPPVDKESVAPTALSDDQTAGFPEPATETRNERRKRPSTAKRVSEVAAQEKQKPTESETESSESSEMTCLTSESSEVDVYEFTTSSPQPEKQEALEGRRKTAGRQVRSSRRASAAVEGDEAGVSRETSASRRRSMML